MIFLSVETRSAKQIAIYPDRIEAVKRLSPSPIKLPRRNRISLSDPTGVVESAGAKVHID